MGILGHFGNKKSKQPKNPYVENMQCFPGDISGWNQTLELRIKVHCSASRQIQSENDFALTGVNFLANFLQKFLTNLTFFFNAAIFLK
jgi:hypothetical protein